MSNALKHIALSAFFALSLLLSARAQEADTAVFNALDAKLAGYVKAIEPLDAASAAIYGASVGSSGVVLITTKRPQAGKTHVDVNASFGFDQVTNLPTLLTAQQFCDVWAKAIENAPGKTLPTSADPTQYKWANVTTTIWAAVLSSMLFRIKPIQVSCIRLKSST